LLTIVENSKELLPMLCSRFRKISNADQLSKRAERVPDNPDYRYVIDRSGQTGANGNSGANGIAPVDLIETFYKIAKGHQTIPMGKMERLGKMPAQPKTAMCFCSRFKKKVMLLE
jgi:hypothetical protein